MKQTDDYNQHVLEGLSSEVISMDKLKLVADLVLLVENIT